MPLKSVVAWIGAEMEFALSQAVASGGVFEHRSSECGHCVRDFLADLDLRELPEEVARLESETGDALPMADPHLYPATPVVPCSRLLGHVAVAADLGNSAIPSHPEKPLRNLMVQGGDVLAAQDREKFLEVNETMRVWQEPGISPITPRKSAIRHYMTYDSMEIEVGINNER